MTKTAPKKAEATTTEPANWSDLQIAAQIEVVNNTLIDPFTKEIIAKDAGGLLDVRRPGAENMPKPVNEKSSPSVAKAFASWCFDKCAIGALEVETVRERFDLPNFTMPEIDVEVDEVPYAIVTGNYDGESWAILVLNNKIVRVGKRTERGYVWCHSEALRKARGDKMCPRSVRATGPEEVFKALMRSFTGKFQHDPKPEPKEKPAPAKSAKPAPSKASKPTPPKQVPSKAAPKKVPSKK